MSSGLPKRPPGPPPGRPPALDTTKSPGSEIKRPPGPPPSGAPNTAKPPPMAPPPRNLAQNFQRPGIESVKPDVKPVLLSDSPADEAKKESAPPKGPPSAPVAQQKAGAISMFEEEVKVQSAAAAEPKGPGIRGPRPPPPRINPPGIPEGQPLPPTMKPDKESKAPPPVRLPPRGLGGGRAPPKEEPLDLATRNAVVPDAPTTEPPLLRVKKPKEKPFVKRRDRDMPEFESSDEDEEGPTLVKQPLPFGVIKQEIPGSALAKPAPVVEEKDDDFEPPPMMPGSVKFADAPDRSMASIDASVQSQDKSSKLEAPPVNKLSEFVPAAPAITLDKHHDDSSLAKTLNRGRLSIKCIEGFEIRRKDDQDKIPRNDPYLRFRLGVVERLPWKATEAKRKQGANPQFEDEVVFFDVVDPGQFVFQEDLQLCIELWNKSSLRNELVASVTMSVVRFMKKPFVSYTEKVPIYYPGMTRSLMKLHLEFVYEEARSGLVQITLFEAHGLRNIDPMGQQDPYVQFSLGRSYKKRSRSVKNGGSAPYFQEEEILLWVDGENWVDDLQVDLLDEDAKEEKPIGSTHFSLLPYMKNSPDDAKEDSYDLFYTVQLDPKDDTEKKEVACGELVMRVRFLPAGKLVIYVDRAKNLQFPESHKPVAGEAVRVDPYVNLSLEGKAVKMVKRTPADKDGGFDPVWENEVRFDVVDQYSLLVEVMNQNLLGKDVLMGDTTISLLNVFRNGFVEFWTSLKQKKMNGGVKEVGEIFVRITFGGPVGISFPQLRPEIDGFDDTLRKPAEIKQIEAPEDRIKPVISTIPDEKESADEMKQRLLEMQQKQMAEGDGLPPEFSEEEILAAFKFIDLDHNNFVGAAEIRHILVCMGEMITDEEIDTMIAMVDLDGDGQVSYKEFRALVLHPNPGMVDMHKEINKDRDQEIMKEKQALAGKSQGVDLLAFQRQREMTTREQKKKFISAFVVDNEVNFEYIQKSYYEFLELPRERRVNGRVQFAEFCKVMRVEPITEYKNIHAFYDTEELGDMDLREFLLSMMNFVEVDRETRIKFTFEMFDETKTGYISQKEIEEILRGNHMMSLQSVQKKAETIMRQAQAAKNGMITLNEFLVVSKKFPNILLPQVGFIPNTKPAMIEL